LTGFDTDKVDIHGYLPGYLRLAAALPAGAVVCEVGVWQGASLAMWQHLLPQAVVIGVDNHAAGQCRWPQGTRQIAAAQDDPALPALVREHAPSGCDLVVDDASHIGTLTLATFKLLWPLVKPGGYYVVEDWADPWVFPDWDLPQDDRLVDAVPKFIEALRDGAETVTYTRLGLVIAQKTA
jgi:cephalosporin hydroxylase